MHTAKISALLLLTCLSAPVAAQEPVPVPTRVRYQQSDAATLRPMVARVSEVLGKGYRGSDHLSDRVLVCGPFLWKRVGPQLAGKGIPMHVRIPTRQGELVAESRTFSEAAESLAVEGLVREQLAKDGPFTVRKLNLDELNLLWTICSDDLSDPLLLVESPHHKFVLIFLKDKLFQVDDFYAANLTDLGLPHADGPHPFISATADRFWAQPHPESSASQPTSGEGIQILSKDQEITDNLTVEQLAAYIKAQQAILKDAATTWTPKTPRNLGAQVELGPGTTHFVTIVCNPPLPAPAQQELEKRMLAVPFPGMKSTIGLQLFSRIWGGL